MNGGGGCEKNGLRTQPVLQLLIGICSKATHSGIVTEFVVLNYILHLIPLPSKLSIQNGRII